MDISLPQQVVFSDTNYPNGLWLSRAYSGSRSVLLPTRYCIQKS